MPQSNKPPLHIIILAAGHGKRMESDLPKVLMPLGGRPMLAHVLEVARSLQADAIHVVYGIEGDMLKDACDGADLSWVQQAERLGTGHAVLQALPEIPDASRVLVLFGDTPLVPAEALDALLGTDAAVNFLSMHPIDPTGYGRVLRDDRGQVQGIVEQKDATTKQAAIAEVNTGILTARAGALRGWLDRVGNNNAQGEYYLTDVIALAVEEGLEVRATLVEDADLLAGANDRWQLAQLERRYQLREAERLCRAGVTVMDPHRLDVRGRVQTGRDVVLDVNVVLEGEVVLKDGVRIGPNCLIRDAEIQSGSQVLANTVIEQARIGERCRIGPFARIRPGTETGSEVAIGNFVETKKSRIGTGSKLNHLSYVGDTQIGARVNVGAGTITCNYDGAAKHETIVGDDVFIGSNTALVAPVTVADGATIGAGSTITRDAPAGKLTLSRARQETVEGWKRPKKT